MLKLDTPSDQPDHIWTNDMIVAAAREGWLLSDTGYCSFLPELQRIDSPEDVNDGWSLPFMPPYLESDEAAWNIVREGTQRHHVVARSILMDFNPEEYERVMRSPPACITSHDAHGPDKLLYGGTPPADLLAKKDTKPPIGGLTCETPGFPGIVDPLTD